MIEALLLLTAFAQATAAPAAGDEAARALAVLERTKTTRATYALYLWAWMEDADGGLRDEWAAEFHSGARHRVETPDVRIVADCDAQTGTALVVASGERITGRQVSQVACGINTVQPILEAAALGSLASRFGAVDRLRIVDADAERFYAVDRDGILVGAEIYRLRGRGCLQNEPLAVERTLPDGDLFSEESLERSFVAERYRRAPERRIGDLWTPGRTCPSARRDATD